MGDICHLGFKTAGSISGQYVWNSQIGGYGKYAAFGTVFKTILCVINCLYSVCDTLSETVVSQVEGQMVYGGGAAGDLLVFSA